jgi:PEGA domain-containing protein
MRIARTVCAACTMAAFVCSSCATLIHGGGTQTVSISTNPPGATVKVGGEQVVSPAEVTLDRNKTVQVVAMLPGYQMATTTIHSEFSWVSVLDLVFIIPWVIDLVSGAAYTLSPETVDLVLEPEFRDVPRAQLAPAVPTAAPLPAAPVAAASNPGVPAAAPATAPPVATFGAPVAAAPVANPMQPQTVLRPAITAAPAAPAVSTPPAQHAAPVANPQVGDRVEIDR